MANDETKIEGQQESSSSEEKQTLTEGSEAVKTPESKDTVPYDRFKEVIDDKNEMKTKFEILEKEIETLKQQKVTEEEPLDWKEAETRTVNKAVSKIEQKAQVKADQERQEELRIENSFEQLKEIGQEITPDIKRAVLIDMIKTGDGDVLGTYLKLKKQLIVTQKTEQQKEEGFVPSSDKGATAGESGMTYKQLRGTSLDDIVEKASKAK